MVVKNDRCFTSYRLQKQRLLVAATMKKPPGGGCAEDSNCVANAVCLRQCNCVEEFQPEGLHCVAKEPGLGDLCDTDVGNCTVENSECIGEEESMTCQCKDEFEQVGEECIGKEPGLGDLCNTTVGNCTEENSECMEEEQSMTCQCKDELEQVGEECIAKEPGLGDLCDTDVGICTVTNSECIGEEESKTCQCKDGFEEVGEDCIGNEPGLGDLCNTTVGNCTVENSECIGEEESKTCQCKDGFEQVGEVCIPQCALIDDCDELLDIIDDLSDMLNNSNSLDIISNLTSAIGNDEELSGEEIDSIVDFLEPLFKIFLENLGGDGMHMESAQMFLTDFTMVTDYVLRAGTGWMNITQRKRTETFSALLTTVSHYSLMLLEKLILDFHEEFEFAEEKSTFLIEISGHKKGVATPLIFPSTESKTYLKLPRTFQDDLDGDYFSYVGVLYNIQYVNQLLPGHRNVLKAQKTVNSKLLSLTFEVDQTTKLTNNVTLVMENMDAPRDPPYHEIWRDLHEGEEPTLVPLSHRCTFWNFNNQGYWDTTGCHEVSSDRDQTICECNHLTNFGVLMDLHGYVGRSVGLQVLTICLSSISILGLTLALVIFHISENATLKSVKLNRHLCFCLLVCHILLLLLIDRQVFNLPEIGCALSGVLLHYFFLCAFMWMALEGIFIYQHLAQVFPTNYNLSTRMYLIVGYAVPFGIVGITAAVSFATDTHGYGDGEL
ncbi:unnamed protein product [Darwinula stevensoni]|uniref:Uncharacterized protein n=1 Tax=Darwinula stevensoni TaxID=69355 RepID=A0A7R9A6F8_9CRUS|nr:unnamed protein product [Darwinula stevensoni]CAG0894430.1 unnamed protein product [Darwinula stevensoni]